MSNMDAFSQPIICELLDDYPLAHLDAGRPREQVCSKLQALTIESLFEPRKVIDCSMASCCLSAIWLWHNYLDESHKISQEIETSAGSAWHGIMHRREGDFWNANYWFARVRDKELFSDVAEEFSLRGFGRTSVPPNLASMLDKPWSPAAFTHEVERILKTSRSDQIEAALMLATAEWRALFCACWNSAIQGAHLGRV
jgi:hypothetical protein